MAKKDQKNNQKNKEEKTPKTLLGSSVLPSLFLNNKEEEVTLGEVVATAQEKSGLTIEKWNELVTNNPEEAEKLMALVVNELELKPHPSTIEVKGEENLSGSEEEKKELKIKEEEEKQENLENQIKDLPKLEFSPEQESLKAEYAIKLVKEVRLEIDSTMQKAEHHLGNSSDVYKQLFLGKAWLGKVLGLLGSAYPYPPADNVKDIPKTVDVAENALINFRHLDSLEKVNILRDTIKKISEHLRIIDFDLKLNEEEQNMMELYFGNSFTRLCEANFYLGYQLSIMRR